MRYYQFLFLSDRKCIVDYVQRSSVTGFFPKNALFPTFVEVSLNLRFGGRICSEPSSIEEIEGREEVKQEEAEERGNLLGCFLT